MDFTSQQERNLIEAVERLTVEIARLSVKDCERYDVSALIKVCKDTITMLTAKKS